MEEKVYILVCINHKTGTKIIGNVYKNKKDLEETKRILEKNYPEDGTYSIIEKELV